MTKYICSIYMLNANKGVTIKDIHFMSRIEKRLLTIDTSVAAGIQIPPARH
jgi:hypothetical protein